jgi:hypothetical protein
MDEEYLKKLFSVTKDTFGEDYDDKLFEQYRIYLGNIDSLENRRKVTHSFFLSVNTGLIAALGILTQFGLSFESNNHLWLIGGNIAGMLFAYSWFRTIRSYILLGTVKWDIVLEIEKKLPLKIHEIEWEILRSKKGRAKYRKLTDVELAIPLIFIGLYVLLLIIITGIMK